MTRKPSSWRFDLRPWVLLVLALPVAALAQLNYPTRPIRFITPYAPGGSTTTMAHVLGQKLAASWGQNVIVDNRPGAGGKHLAAVQAKLVADRGEVEAVDSLSIPDTENQSALRVAGGALDLIGFPELLHQQKRVDMPLVEASQ